MAMEAAESSGWFISNTEVYCPECLENWLKMVEVAGIDLEVKDERG
jgi:hypothetical protein